MGKPDPRETTGRPGPVRTSSGTRVIAVRVTTPIEPSVTAQRSANDVNELPTMELDTDQLRALALHCASDVGHVEPAEPPPAADKPSRPRLQLVFIEDEEPRVVLDAVRHDSPQLEEPVDLPRRPRGLTLVVVLCAIAVVAVVVSRVYGVLP
jgi:hypothetical protein